MKFKKYVIHILAIGAINYDTFDLPPAQNAIIVCTDRDNKYLYVVGYNGKQVFLFVYGIEAYIVV